MPAQHAVPGFDAAGFAAGIKKNGALDLALVTSSIALPGGRALYAECVSRRARPI